MATKKKFVVYICPLFFVVLFIGPRLWLEFRPMTQSEREDMTKSTTVVPTNTTMTDHLPYPATDKQNLLSFRDVLSIRAMASWCSLFPYRTVALNVSSQKNASMSLYERNTFELEFTKDESGWHMKPVGGIIDWVSEDGKPTISFH